jgi:hypothetical protein
MSEIDNKKGELQIHDIEKISVSTRKFVELSVILFSDDGEEVRFQIEIHVVNRLPIDILLGNNFLRPNGINILILLLINGLSVFQMHEYLIILKESRRSIDPLKTFRKRTVIKAAEILVITAGIE